MFARRPGPDSIAGAQIFQSVFSHPFRNVRAKDAQTALCDPAKSPLGPMGAGGQQHMAGEMLGGATKMPWVKYAPIIKAANIQAE